MNQRPTSPHLQVYRLPLTAILSISHRITGVVLTLGLLAIAGIFIAAVAGSGAFSILIGGLASLPGQVALWLWLFSLFFHTCHGIRHLLWDAGLGLDRDVVARHNLIEIVLAVLCTIGAFAISHTSRSGVG